MVVRQKDAVGERPGCGGSEPRLSASMEDYLEAVYLTGREKDEVRPGDLAARLHVSASSVTEALHVLREKGLIAYMPYGPIALTEAGLRAAEDVYYRHSMIARFLTDILGVETGAAEESACRLEHAIAPGVLRRFVVYMQFIQERGQGEPQMDVRAFKEYYRQTVTQDGER